MPLILKLNNSDTLAKVEQPVSAVTGSVEDALRLGCVGVGYTIYPGSGARNRMYEDLREIALEAKRRGLVVVVWSYPRGAGLSKQGETAIDVCAYAATIAAQLGAHIIKVKPPTAHIEQEEAKKMYEKYSIPIQTLADRDPARRAGDVRRKARGDLLWRRVEGDRRSSRRGARDGRGRLASASIMGRNAFQRPRAEALKLLADVIRNLQVGALTPLDPTLGPGLFGPAVRRAARARRSDGGRRAPSLRGTAWDRAELAWDRAAGAEPRARGAGGALPPAPQADRLRASSTSTGLAGFVIRCRAGHPPHPGSGDRMPIAK